jgi:hypothetical protein
MEPPIVCFGARKYICSRAGRIKGSFVAFFHAAFFLPVLMKQLEMILGETATGNVSRARSMHVNTCMGMITRVTKDRSFTP